jgi:hypothetical protein
MGVATPSRRRFVEIKAMSRSFSAVFAIVAMLAWTMAASAQETHTRTTHRHVHGGAILSMHPGQVYSSGGHYAALVGDPGSGAGFYPLPYQVRVGAWRHRMETEAPLPPWINPNPVQAAAQAQAVRYWGWGDPTPADSYHYGVYNPIDGVGSPFFAGYYGAAGDDDDDSGFPFGHPYGP